MWLDLARLKEIEERKYKVDGIKKKQSMEEFMMKMIQTMNINYLAKFNWTLQSFLLSIKNFALVECKQYTLFLYNFYWILCESSYLKWLIDYVL